MKHPLQDLWTGLLAAPDFGGCCALADLLMESWDDLVRDDAEFHREFGRPLPYLAFLDGLTVRLKVRYHPEEVGRFVMWCERTVPPARGLWASYFIPVADADGQSLAALAEWGKGSVQAPTEWDAGTVERFAAWVFEQVGRPTRVIDQRL